MNDLVIILKYEFKMKFRAIKSMIKNLLVGLIILLLISVFGIIQFGKFILLNLELISSYRNAIILLISAVIVIFTLIKQDTPFKWHPASMIYLSGDKFKKVFKLSLFKKIVSYLVFATFVALILNNLKINLETIHLSLSLCNIFTVSAVARYFIYNRCLDFKIVGLLITYIILVNLQLHTNIYLALILILYLTYLSGLWIKRMLNINVDFDKLFTEMIFLNRAQYLARENLMEDGQEFIRERTAEKTRRVSILRNISFIDPLVEKNLITFSRINLTLSIYILIIFTAIILSYRFELFKFVKTIKKLGIGRWIISLHQALLINNIVNLIVEQKNLLVEKGKKGLYLPYKKYEINRSFMILGLPVLSFVTFMVGLIFGKPIWKIVIESILYSIILLISLAYDKNRASDFFGSFIYIIIFGVSYIFTN